MAIVFNIKTTLLKSLLKLEESLENTGRLTKQLAILGVEESRKAFQRQGLGDIKWEPRYPSMPDPFINIAGTLQDFMSGRTAPKPNRFDRRPAVVDEGLRGGIWGSISFDGTTPDNVVWGSNKEYANKHQEGGQTTITLNEAGKKRLKDWLMETDSKGKSVLVGAPQKERKERAKLSKKDKLIKKAMKEASKSASRRAKESIRSIVDKIKKKAKGIFGGTPQAKPIKPKGDKKKTVRKSRVKRSAFIKKLIKYTLPNVSEYTQEVLARPFLGITPGLARHMLAAVKRYFNEAQK